MTSKITPRAAPLQVRSSTAAVTNAPAAAKPRSTSGFSPAASVPLELSANPAVALPKVDPKKFDNIDQYKEVGPDHGKGDNPYCAPTDVLMAARYFADILPNTQYVKVRVNGKDQALPTSGDTATLVKGLYDRYGTVTADNGTNRDELKAMLDGAGLQTVAENPNTPTANDAIVKLNGTNVVNEAFIDKHLAAGHPVMIHGDGHWMMIVGKSTNPAGYEVCDSAAGTERRVVKKDELYQFLASVPGENLYPVWPKGS